MEIIKNYLTIEELANIVDQMIASPTSYNREIIKISLVSQYCVDDDFEDKYDGEIYNIVAKNGLLEEYDYKITNYYMIDRMVKEELGVEKSIREFLNSLDEKVEDITKKIPKNFNLEDFFANVKKASSNGENV